MAGAAEIRRPRRGRHVLRRRRLPPPPVPCVARAPAAGALVGARPRRRLPRPLLPALVGRVPLRSAFLRLHGVHAPIFPLRSSVRSLRHRRARLGLAQVSPTEVGR